MSVKVVFLILLRRQSEIGAFPFCENVTENRADFNVVVVLAIRMTRYIFGLVRYTNMD